MTDSFVFQKQSSDDSFELRETEATNEATTITTNPDGTITTTNPDGTTTTTSPDGSTTTRLDGFDDPDEFEVTIDDRYDLDAPDISFDAVFDVI